MSHPEFSLGITDLYDAMYGENQFNHQPDIKSRQESNVANPLLGIAEMIETCIYPDLDRWERETWNPVIQAEHWGHVGVYLCGLSLQMGPKTPKSLAPRPPQNVCIKLHLGVGQN